MNEEHTRIVVTGIAAQDTFESDMVSKTMQAHSLIQRKKQIDTFTKRASVPLRYSSKLHNASYVNSVGLVNITGEGPPETVGDVGENGGATLKFPGELLK